MSVQGGDRQVPPHTPEIPANHLEQFSPGILPQSEGARHGIICCAMPSLCGPEDHLSEARRLPSCPPNHSEICILSSFFFNIHSPLVLIPASTSYFSEIPSCPLLLQTALETVCCQRGVATLSCSSTSSSFTLPPPFIAAVHANNGRTTRGNLRFI